jgi:acyl-coenzyme A synthetase/AMP-(fatty) acid ligase
MSGLLWRVFEEVAASRGDAPALIHGEERVSFQDLHRLALQCAAAAAKHGLNPGDRCLIYGANSARTAAAILATWRLDAIVVLIPDDAPPTHLEHAQHVCHPRLAMVDTAWAQTATTVLTCPVLLLDDPINGAYAAADAPVRDRRDALGAAPASIFFTSGSTGQPKGVTQSHATLLAGCRMVASHMGYTQSDSIVCPVPWAFDYGYGQLLSTLLLGLTQVIPSGRGAHLLCEAIAAHRPTVFATLPSIQALLLRGVSPVRQTDLSSLRLITNTGGAIPEAIFNDTLQVFANCALSLNYGMTETYRSAGLPFDLAQARPTSVGFGYPGVSIAVVRPDGAEAEPDEEGEIIHRGTGAFMGYWGDPGATAKVLRPDPLWPHGGVDAPKVVFTGDVGTKDENGFLSIKGRRDRMIKSMGFRVSLDEIEVLLRRSGVARELVVVSVPHEVLGQTIVAIVRRENETDNPVPALKAYARQTFGRYMQPQDYRVVDEFPLTQNRKIDLVKLARDYAANASQWGASKKAAG